MPTRSKSPITTDIGRRLPRNRPPTHPGEMLFEEFIKPLGLTQTELARCLGVSYPRLNEIIKGRRSVTPDTALRLSRVLGMPAENVGCILCTISKPVRFHVVRETHPT